MYFIRVSLSQPVVNLRSRTDAVLLPVATTSAALIAAPNTHTFVNTSVREAYTDAALAYTPATMSMKAQIDAQLRALDATIGSVSPYNMGVSGEFDRSVPMDQTGRRLKARHGAQVRARGLHWLQSGAASACCAFAPTCTLSRVHGAQ